MPNRRLLFLATGGTFGMSRKKDALEPDPDVSMPFLRGLSDIAEVEGRQVANIDSSDMTPALWEVLGQHIAEGMDRYDGFVVLHGTDTMAFTASALSFMLENLPKPVILTGSQRPMAERRTDAESNLVHSAHCATLSIPEVGLYFGSALLRGNRATKVSVQSYNAFQSPNFPALVEMGVDIVPRFPPRPPTGPFHLRPGFCAEIAVLTAFPGQSPNALDAAVAAGNRAVVIRSFGEGNLPLQGWPDAIAAAVGAGVPVVIATQCTLGRVTPGRYRNSAVARDAGATFTADMTLEAALVKTMWLLGQNTPPDAFNARFTASIAGECSPASGGLEG